MRRFVLTAVALALLVPTTAVVASTTPSGLRGTVVRSPARPVCIEDEPCTKPAAGFLLVFSRAGAVVARTTTRVDGSYRVPLRPGIYTVRAPAAPRVGAGLTPRLVRVPTGRFARIDFVIDTGLQ
ncbi:MAG: hypothetical protein EXQ81_12030 [Thermoleophilia bacterium]|nr:hypothetical protein [Thermoleophilia bacterium]